MNDTLARINTADPRPFGQGPTLVGTGRGRPRFRHLAVLGVVLLAGCAPAAGGCAPTDPPGSTTSTTIDDGSTTTSTTQPAPTTTVPDDDLLPVEQVQPETCFIPADDGEFVDEVRVSDCDTPHMMEAFAAYQLPDSAYPGNDELRRSSYDRCQDWFSDYVGADFWESRFDITAITPSPSTWSDGDRSVVCVLVDVNGSELDSPARNSGE